LSEAKITSRSVSHKKTTQDAVKRLEDQSHAIAQERNGKAPRATKKGTVHIVGGGGGVMAGSIAKWGVRLGKGVLVGKTMREPSVIS